MAEKNENNGYYLTDKGFYTYGDIIKDGYVPFFCIDSVKIVRKIQTIIRDEIADFNLEYNTRIKHRNLFDTDDGVMKTVFFVDNENYEKFANFLQKSNFKQKIVPYFKECGMINVFYDFDNVALKKSQIKQIVEPVVVAEKKKEKHQIMPKSTRKPQVKSAKPKTKKPVKNDTKPKSENGHRNWGIKMPPLPENATAEDKRQRKLEYHRLLNKRMKEVEQEYIESLSEEERQKYLEEKRQKSSKKYYEKKQKNKERLAEMTSDEIQAERDKENMLRRNRYAKHKEREQEMLAQMSQEEQETYLREKRKKYRDRAARVFENKTEEGKKDHLERHRQASKKCYHKRIEKMTDEEREEFLQKRRERERKKLANMTEDEYKAYIENRRERERKKAAKKRALKKQEEAEKTQ